MKLFFSLGEPSGDLHAANLLRELGRHEPGLRASGFGGPRMAAAGCELIQDMSELAVMGLGPVLAKLPRFFGLLSHAERIFKEQPPDAVVLVDYPGFNWHVARKAKEHGIPVFYYGLPQLWAWASWRVKKVRKYVDHALCKLPFEEQWFRERGCNATYFGHPYFDELSRQAYDHPFLDRLAMDRRRLVTILPGSRTQEIKSNLPTLLHAAKKIRSRVSDARFGIACLHERHADLAKRYVSRAGVAADVYAGHTPELIESAYCCLACSGSVSLELLYHAKPTVVSYRMPPLSYWLVRRLVQVRYITLVNLLATDQPYFDRKHRSIYNRHDPTHAQALMPEYHGYSDRSEAIAEHAIEWLTDEAGRQEVIAKLKALKAMVAQSGASSRGAEYILRNLRQPEIVRPSWSSEEPRRYRRAS